MKKTVHMIGNAHLDIIWLWDWKEGFQESKATFKSALDRLDEFDGFVFTSSSAQLYKWIEENEPDMFLKIKKRIQSGRWVICGGWWVQPDCNIPSGESLVRQGLLAQNYFYEKFGVTAHTGYCVDSFGHNAMLPQILIKSGMDNYVFMRPDDNEKQIPERAFFWESPDGSRVAAFRIFEAYGFSVELEENINKILSELPGEVDDTMLFYGVGNHGGGPTIENIRTILALQQSRKDIKIRFSTPDKYFDAIKSCKLPVVKGELQYHSRGCYSAESEIKRLNREAENTLLRAEKLSVISDILGKGRFTNGLNSAWEKVLLNQFHDALAGTSIKSAYKYTRNQLGYAMTVADQCENNAVQAISFDINIPMDESTLPVVVFNPHSWEVTAPVEFETGMFVNTLNGDFVSITDSNGKELPCQEIEAQCGVLNRKRRVFSAQIPALGYAVFTARAESGKMTPAFGTTEYTLENDLISVGFNMKLGTIDSLVDKRTGTEIIVSSAQCSVINDECDTWGHTLKKFERTNDRFICDSVQITEAGSVRTTIRFACKYGKSTLCQSYTLYDGDNKVIVNAEIDWHEYSKAVKFDFPVNVKNSKTVCEIPFGFIEKEHGSEETMQRWADISDDNCGLTVVNNGKYGVDFNSNVIGITILRSTAYAQHDPYKPETGEAKDYIDYGYSKFTYVLMPHIGGCSSVKAVRAAAELNQGIISYFETFHNGDLPLSGSFISINADNIVMSALKHSYDGKSIILRLYEACGKNTTVDIKIFSREIKTEFGPFEIKTFSIYADGLVEPVNLIEKGMTEE